MSDNTPSTKLEQFDEFFSIAHEFTVNFHVLNKEQIPSFDLFMQRMPLPFKIASDMVSLDQASLRPIQGLSGVASQLVDYLNHQANKIDLLVGYILSQQDQPEHRYQGTKVGGGGIIFSDAAALNVGDMLEMKVFLLTENCAAYCLGEIVEVAENEGQFSHKVIFHYIREEDREMLVRTSLHLQSKQLQALAQQRNQDSQ